jgi:cell shape-determining protein MreC
VVLLGALARLQPGNTPIIGQLHAQLDNKRREVRRAAIDAVVAVGDGSSIAALEERRGKESRPRSVKALDEALEKLRTKRRVAEQLQAEVETLRKQNEELRERLKNAEKTPQQ